jgi:hypothetical protein
MESGVGPAHLGPEIAFFVEKEGRSRPIGAGGCVVMAFQPHEHHGCLRFGAQGLGQLLADERIGKLFCQKSQRDDLSSR